LKIGVNSRIFLEKGSGVPNYVACLYRKCLEIDATNRYVFFQPNLSHTIGSTQVAHTQPGLLGAALFDCLRVQRLIRQAKLDVFHGPAHILPLRKCTGVKYVVTIHDLAFRVLPSQYDWKHRCYYGWQLSKAVKMADVVVAVSHNTKKDIVRFYGLPEERIEVVHLGVADHFLKSPESPCERLIADRYFLSITTHPKRKNILGTLKAFAMFAGQCDRLKYVIAGLIGVDQRNELCSLADQLGIREKVVLFGYADDDQLIELYRNAEFLIYPSFYEGFGLPLVEAMACGCPVIASNTSSLPEIMPDNEWLVDPYNPVDMAGQMQRMLKMPPEKRCELIKKNQKHVSNFTWDKAARRMIKIFEGLGGTTS
jgi:glycosyltransferase involved in cell wall biosynthesis